MVSILRLPGSQAPHVHLLGHHAPVGVVVVGGDDVQVFHIFLYHVVYLAFSEDMVVPALRCYKEYN